MVLGVIVLPSLFVIWLSFQSSTFGQSARFVGWDNYVRVLGDPYFWRALFNTVLVIAAAVHIEMLIGLGMALLFSAGLPMRRLLLVVVLAPYAISEVTAVAMWRFLFDPDVGPVTAATAWLGLPPRMRRNTATRQAIACSISPEMETPKLMWLKRHVPESWERAGHFFDLADFLTWRATGSTARSQCTLTCKWTYLPHEGGWQRDFFEAVGIPDMLGLLGRWH